MPVKKKIIVVSGAILIVVLSALAYLSAREPLPATHAILNDDFVYIPAGVYTVGSSNRQYCSFDAEMAENVYCGISIITQKPFLISKYAVCNAEFQQFILDGGYDNREYWSKVGWLWRSNCTNKNSIQGDYGNIIPMFWDTNRRPMWRTNEAADYPVHAVSYYEAEAYANSRGCRLPYQREWAVACIAAEDWGNWSDSELHSIYWYSNKLGIYNLNGNTSTWCIGPMSDKGVKYDPLFTEDEFYNWVINKFQIKLRNNSDKEIESILYPYDVYSAVDSMLFPIRGMNCVNISLTENINYVRREEMIEEYINLPGGAFPIHYDMYYYGIGIRLVKDINE